jgi:hypothetical protein
MVTYNLVDVGDLGLEDGDGVTDGGFLVHLGGCSEGHLGHLSHTLSLIESCEELGQHSRYLLNLYISFFLITIFDIFTNIFINVFL